MATTVRETLALESFKGIRVLAGLGGLDREISTTTFIEAPDSWKWIRGGEYVLTLAYAFQTEELLLKLIRELIELNAACIGIKTERYIKQIPQSVLDLADQYQFPIIDIPTSLPFAAIIHPVQSLIIHNQERLLKYSEKVRHSFFGLSVQAAEIEEIMQALCEFTHVDLAFLDLVTNRKYVFSDTSQLPAALDTLPLKDVLKRYPHEDVTLNGRLMGYLIFDADVEKLKDRWSEIPINQAKGALLLYFQRREARHQVESRYRNEFVQDLITRNIRMEQEAWNRAKSFNWNLEGPQRVVIVDIDNYKSSLTRAISNGQGVSVMENSKSRIYSIARSFLAHLNGGKYPYAEMSDSIVFIFPSGDENGGLFNELLRHALVDMMKAIQSETGFTVTVGVGDPCPNVFNCPKSYHQAQQGLELLRQSQGGNVIASWSEMGVYKLLSGVVETSDGCEFMERYLGPLLNGERSLNVTLLDTIQTTVNSNWNLKDAAAAMGVHYNTLKYRWRKICDLLEIDMSKSSDRLNVMIALELYRMHNKNSGNR